MALIVEERPRCSWRWDMAMLSCLDELSVSQKEALDRFQKVLEDRQIPHKKDDSFTFLRFLKARSFDVDKARSMYEAMIKWRADTIKEDFDFQEREATQELYPRFYHKTDKLGRPIYIERLGKLRVEQLLKVTTMERMLLDHIREWEIFSATRLPACSRKAGKNVTQSLAILDLNGVVVKHLSKEVRQFIKNVLKIDQDYYPEFLGQMVIVNAPVFFKAIWSMVRPWLDKHTEKKIEVYGTNFAPRLLELVESNNLPAFLGGSCHCCASARGCESSNAGPWNDKD